MTNPNRFVIDPRDRIEVACYGAQLGAHVLVEYLMQREAARIGARAAVQRSGRRHPPPKIHTRSIHEGLHEVFEHVRRIAHGKESR